MTDVSARDLQATHDDPLDLTRADLWAEDRWQEPMRELRERGPIHWTEASKFGPHWSVMQYKPIQHIEALPKIFSSSWEYGGINIERDDINDPRDHNMPLPMFIAMDPPQHSAQRRTVAPAFGPAEVERMRADAVAPMTMLRPIAMEGSVNYSVMIPSLIASVA